MFKYTLTITSDKKIDKCSNCRFTREHNCPRSGHTEITCMWLGCDVTYIKEPKHVDCPLDEIGEY